MTQINFCFTEFLVASGIHQKATMQSCDSYLKYASKDNFPDFTGFNCMLKKHLTPEVRFWKCHVYVQGNPWATISLSTDAL